MSTQNTSFKHLFRPIDVGHKTLKHRLNFGAHTANMAVDGLPGERHHGYYLERAIGGAAMIVVEPIPVHGPATLTRGNFRHSDDAVIPHFRRITDSCHEYGTVMIQQLYHVGQHGDWDNSFLPNWSPSGLPSMHDHDGSMAMSKHQIDEVIEAFVASAVRAKKAGFDGCELMAAYNAIIEQFWSPFNNRREDCYGGSFENRMRFSTELLSAIRNAVGNDFIIGVCTSYDPVVPDVLPMEAMQEIVAYHDSRGLFDYVTIGTGGYYNFYLIMPTAMHEDQIGMPFAANIREVVKHAKVQAESHIRTPDAADYAIGSGAADMVSIVRGQIADPHLANKAMQGRAEDIRPCLSCNQMCWGRRFKDYWISCLINPSAGREFEWGGDRFVEAEDQKKILVVGGGPAGCEAARVAAERGHTVTLVEASGQLGGQFRLAGMQPRRGQILDYIDWFERQLNKLGVEVRLNTPFFAEDVVEFGADAVILATGSLPSDTGYQRGIPTRDVLPGIDQGNVWHAEDVMNRSAKLGQSVLLLDDVGTWKSLGTAVYLVEKGHSVSIVTPYAVIGRELVRTAADYAVREKLRQYGAQFYPETVVNEWQGTSARVMDLLDESETEMPFDSLVLATVNMPVNDLELELRQQTLEFDLHVIGDCLSPRQAPAATYEGRKVSLLL